MMNKGYEDFNVGEICIFEKKFTEQDFANFSLLSGDTNPLHHDCDYAKKTSFKQTIVPLHLASAPLSSIAGVVFPGDNALYLGHDLKALKPIPYNVDLTYSSKIIEKIDRDKILVLRTIVFNETAIYIEAIQRIQVRDDLEYLCPSDVKEFSKRLFSLPDEAIFITGAAGELGRSAALRFAKIGKKLVLNFRKHDERITELITKLESFDCDIELLELDLESAEETLVIEKVKQLNSQVGAVVHCACPAVGSDLSEHIKVNYQSLQIIFSVLKFQWLSYQSGKIIFLSSSATFHHPEGWDDYIVAKSATENYLKGVHQRYSHYGINTHILSPGRIDSAFSKGLGLDSIESLMVEQVTEEIVCIHENISPFYTWLEVDSKRIGSTGFIDIEQPSKNIDSRGKVASQSFITESTNIDSSDLLKHFFNRFFKITVPVNWDNLAINMISAWDSLRHIELLMALESEFDITVTTNEVDQTKSFKGILSLLNNKKK